MLQETRLFGRNGLRSIFHQYYYLAKTLTQELSTETSLAPVVLFVFNRPEHAQQLLDSLSENSEASETVLYVYCDGPRPDASETLIKTIRETREVCKSEHRFAEVHIIERESNLGLAESIISGVTEVIQRHGAVIVLEDDLVVSRYFLRFMNDALNVYADNELIISVGACNYFRNWLNFSPTCFLPVPDCLGWATWSSRWKLFEPDSAKLLGKIKNQGLEHEFNLHGYFDFLSMLQAQCNNKVSSWAIRWQAVAYLHKMVTVYPNRSVSQHRMSSTATHYGGNICPPLAKRPIRVELAEPRIGERDYYCMIRAFLTSGDSNWWSRTRKRFILFSSWRRKFVLSKRLETDTGREDDH